MPKPLILAVDDDVDMGMMIKSIGETSGFDVCATNSARAFQRAWQDIPPSVIVMDIVMPDMDGIELLTWLADQKCSAPIILMSGYGDQYLNLANTVAKASGENIIGMLKKPFDVEDLEELLRTVQVPTGHDSRI